MKKQQKVKKIETITTFDDGSQYRVIEVFHGTDGVGSGGSGKVKNI